MRTELKMKKIIITLIIFGLTFGFWAALYAEENKNTQEKLTDEYLIRNWRQEKVPLEKLNEHYCKFHSREKGYKIRETEEWKKFEAQMQKGDELWFFSSPPDTWENLMGREGYAIFRNDKLIAGFTTLLN